jgi:hypothetical protein
MATARMHGVQNLKKKNYVYVDFTLGIFMFLF